jgi:galactofuranose transport system permease protein
MMINQKSIFANERLKKLMWPLGALILILIFNLIFTKDFFMIEIKDGHLFGSIIDIINRGAPVMLISIGMTLVYATGGIDISVGAVIAISGAMAAYIIRPTYATSILAETKSAAPLILVVAIPLLVSTLCGLWNGTLVSFFKIQPIIATLIMMIAGRGIAQLITSGQIIVFEHKAFQFIGSGFLLGLPFPVFLVIFIALFTYLLTRKTAFGIFIEALGDNPIASYYVGIKVKTMKLYVYAFSGFCAGIAGLILTADIKGADANNAGLNLELDAIASVIIGGTIWGGRFTIAGTIIGTLILQSIITTVLQRGVDPSFTFIIKAIVVISVTLIQSSSFRRKLLTRFKITPKTKSVVKVGTE